jgi:hypothetical protein
VVVYLGIPDGATRDSTQMQPLGDAYPAGGPGWSGAGRSWRRLVAPLDYSKPGRIPARQSYVVRPAVGADGGLTQVQGLFAAPFATSYPPAS